MVSDIHTIHVHVHHVSRKKTMSGYTTVYKYAQWDPAIVYEVAGLAHGLA